MLAHILTVARSRGYERLSLSVDRCSPDPTRCWNPAPAGITGPAALRWYLSSMQVINDGGLAFRLP